ncbi:MAG: PfkB family carbohydrate kinase [Thermoguttaceae bacterium]|nr:PfkB family carbohydrate kinase [Thermoguttaceae bacterium]
MNLLRLTETRLIELLARFASLRIAVLGDFFLDRYFDVDKRLAERSIETGKLAHQVVDIRCSPGAAGTVVCNLVSLGVQKIRTIGFTGDDGEGFELRRELQRLGCDTEALWLTSQRHTPTYLKPHEVSDPSLAGEHSRYDTKNRQPLPAELERQIIASLEKTLPNIDMLLIMDQVEEEGCGVLTPNLIAAVNRLAIEFPKVLFWADSRRRIHAYRKMIIKPNIFEATGQNIWAENGLSDFTPNQLPETLRQSLRTLVQRNESPVIVTLGALGVLVVTAADDAKSSGKCDHAERNPKLCRHEKSQTEPQIELVYIPSVHVPEPTDPTGAGDSFTAGMTLALGAGATLEEAALIGNLVASITVQQLATTGTATPDQLHQRWREYMNRLQ